MKNKLKAFASAVLAFSMLMTFIPVSVSAVAVMAEPVNGWQFDGKADAYGCLDYETKYAGDCSYKMTNNSPLQSNIYGRLLHTKPITVKNGVTYRYSFMAKAKSCKGISVMIDWGVKKQLTPIGGTYDWMPYSFEYTHNSTIPTVELSFLVENTSKGFWVDNVEMYELDKNGNEIGANLITNPGFDGAEISSSGTSTDNVVEDISTKANSVKNTDKIFNSSDYLGALGEFTSFPINPAKEITIDGNEAEWEHIPSLEIREGLSTISDYTKDGQAKDVTASIKTMHDEEYLYLLCKVTDDVHKGFNNANYWQGDSIQLCVADMNQTFATEVGFMYDKETDTVPYFGFSENDKVMTKAIADGNTITYELAVPWTFKWESRPDEFLFNIGINDNDGNQRRYGIELTYGICEGAKATAKFQTARTLKEYDSFIAWIEGDKNQFINTDGNFDIFVVNLGEKRTFDITIQPGGEVISETVDSGKGMKYSLNIPMDSLKTDAVSITIDNKTVRKAIEVSPTAETYKPKQTELKSRISEIDALIFECKSKNIPTSYETAGLEVMKYFDEMIQMDIDNSYYKLMDSTFEELDNIYNEMKTSMEQYLSGEKKAFSSPKYVSGSLSYDGPIVYGNTVDEFGNEEKRPLFFIGYGHFGHARERIPLYNSLGINVNQSEIPLFNVIQKGSNFDGWLVTNSAKADATRIEAPDTDSGYALRLVNPRGMESNIYYAINQYIQVRPNSSYELKFKAKATSCGRAWASSNGWQSQASLSGSYDWKEYTIPFETGTETTRHVMFLCDDKTTELLIADVCVTEIGSDENEVENGDFSIYYDEAPPYDTTMGNIGWVRNYLEGAQENNVSITLLLSPHYFPDFLKTAYPDVNYPGTSFLRFNVMHEVALNVAKDFYRAVAEMIKKYDFTCVNSIMISNEWEFETSRLPDFYQPLWAEYLKNKYADIFSLNGIYKTEYADFAEVPMALKENPFAYSDYVEFNDDVTTEWHRIMTEIVNEVLPDMPVQAKIKLNGNLKNGTNFEKLSKFFTMNGNDGYAYLNYGDKYLRKMMGYDYQASFSNVPINNAEDHVIEDAWRYVDSEGVNSPYEGDYYSPKQARFVDADIWQGAVHKRGFSMLWVWDKTYDEMNDLFGSINTRPGAFYQVSKVALDLNRLSEEVAAVERTESEVAIFDSTASKVYSPMAGDVYSITNDNLYYQAYRAMLFNGKKVRFVTENTIDSANEKLLVLSDMRLISDNALEKLLSFKRNGGRLIILGRDSALVNEKNEPISEEMRNELFTGSYIIDTDIQDNKVISPSDDELAAKFGEILSNENMQIIKLIDAATGEHVKNVEYEYGIHEGNIILNICNYEMEKPKTVRVFVGNKEITSYKELRSNENIEGELTLEGYKPVILSFDAEGMFFDMIGHWAEETVSELARKKIINGRTQTTYVPEDNVTRAEFLTLILRAANKATSEYRGGIGDVFADDWHSGYVQTGKTLGIIQNMLSDGRFEPNRAISREEMAAMAVAVYELDNGVINAVENSFKDAAGNEAINKAATINILTGYEDNTVRPHNNLTRAEAAKVILNLLSNKI